jgi:hypothetical protein
LLTKIIFSLTNKIIALSPVRAFVSKSNPALSPLRRVATAPTRSTSSFSPSAAAAASGEVDADSAAEVGAANKVQTQKPSKEELNLPSMEDLVGLCKRRGFIFPSSDIYNGFNGFYDYGPLGVELKQNIKQNWWRQFVHGREVGSCC